MAAAEAASKKSTTAAYYQQLQGALAGAAGDTAGQLAGLSSRSSYDSRMMALGLGGSQRINGECVDIY